MYHLPMIGKAEVRALEECAFNGWPARQTLLMGGWILRLSGGYIKRANSVNALEPIISFQDILEAAESFYARHALPTIFRLSPLAPLQADAILDAAGYVSFDPTLVLTVSLGAQYGPCETRIDEMPTPSWLDGFALAAGIKDAKRAIHDAMVSAIAVRTAFVTVYDAGNAFGFGLAAYERRTIGIFDIAVFPFCRGRGHGRSMMNALLAWGKKLGAKQAFLQVDEQNGIARNLYGSLGFGEAYRYHYRKRPDPEAFNVG